MPILLIVLSVAVTLVIVYLWLRGNKFKDRWWSEYERNSELYETAFEAERAKIRNEMELNYLKATISQLASRNAIAVLTDQQAQHLIEAVAQIVLSAATSPDRLN